MRLNLSSFLTVLFSACCQLAAAQPAPGFQFQFTGQPGPHAVGLKLVEQYDHSRTFDGGGSRPLQTLVWYPAEHSGAKPMNLGDYASLVKTETSFGKPVEHGKLQDHVAEFTQGLADAPLKAVRGAGLEPGHFPLVIYAPSNNSPNTENIELCEYLASNGFVVMASPSLGSATQAMTIDDAGATAQAKDISFLIGFAKTLPDVDPAEVAVIGYSWGGMAGLYAAARDKRIDALVTLDGSFLYGQVTAADVHPDQMTLPLLVFSRGEEPLAFRDSSGPSAAPTKILTEWTHGDLVHLELLATSHISFSSMYQRSERFRNEGLRFAPADYSLEEGAASYNWMARYTLEFLNSYLKHDPASTAFLKRTPAENGVPRHLIDGHFRPATSQSDPTPAAQK